MVEEMLWSEAWLILGPTALLALWLVLRGIWRHLFRPRGPYAVIDGSNVLYWRDKTPDLESLRAVLRLCKAKGYRVGVIFDANAGYKIADRYLSAEILAHRLGLPADRVFIAPKGEQADPFLLDFASREGAIIISNDRFRDRIADYPQLRAPGRLIRGEWQEGKPLLHFGKPGLPRPRG